MGKIGYLDSAKLDAIGNAVREKLGITEEDKNNNLYTVDQIPDKIREITTGDDKNITERTVLPSELRYEDKVIDNTLWSVATVEPPVGFDALSKVNVKFRKGTVALKTAGKSTDMKDYTSATILSSDVPASSIKYGDTILGVAGTCPSPLIQKTKFEVEVKTQAILEIEDLFDRVYVYLTTIGPTGYIIFDHKLLTDILDLNNFKDKGSDETGRYTRIYESKTELEPVCGTVIGVGLYKDDGYWGHFTTISNDYYGDYFLSPTLNDNYTNRGLSYIVPNAPGDHTGILSISIYV